MPCRALFFAQPIAQAVERLYAVVCVVQLFQLSPDAPDMAIDRSVAHIRVLRKCFCQELLSGTHVPGCRARACRMRNSVTVSRTGDPFHAAVNLSVSRFREPDRNIVAALRRPLRRGLSRAAAAKQHFHARGKLPQREGFAQVVVGAQLQSQAPCRTLHPAR